MRRPNATTPRRPGFTLAELVVVLGIILLLVSLIAAAILKISDQGNVLITRKDISDLALAIEQFKSQMHVDYVPSRFRLRENLADYQVGISKGDQLDMDSWSYLKKVWPKLSPNGVVNWIGDPNFPNPPPGGFSAAAVDLEGHQCLVFFLGGIPSGGLPGQGRINIDSGPYIPTGFSTNPTNPAQFAGDRIGPFYNDFKSERLVVLPTSPVGAFPGVTPAQTNLYFFSYRDVWGRDTDINFNNLAAGLTPVYGYFSAYGKQNGYNRYLSGANPYYVATGAGVISDCPSLVVENFQAAITNPPTTTIGLWPYAQKLGGASGTQYANQTTYQIFCAGKNRVFGWGTNFAANPITYTWTPQSANNVSPAGQDDYSNFHDRQLGSGE